MNDDQRNPDPDDPQRGPTEPSDASDAQDGPTDPSDVGDGDTPGDKPEDAAGDPDDDRPFDATFGDAGFGDAPDELEVNLVEDMSDFSHVGYWPDFACSMIDAVNPCKSGFQGKIDEIRGLAVDKGLRPKVASRV